MISNSSYIYTQQYLYFISTTYNMNIYTTSKLPLVHISLLMFGTLPLPWITHCTTNMRSAFNSSSSFSSRHGSGGCGCSNMMCFQMVDAPHTDLAAWLALPLPVMRGISAVDEVITIHAEIRVTDYT